MSNNFSEKDIVTDSGRIPLNPFAYSEKREKDLVLLVVSDIHLDHKKLEKLKGWHKDYNNDIIDFVLIPGDFDNLIQVKGKTDINETSKSEARITNLLNFLEFFSCPLLVIPGNHDPLPMFDSHAKTSEISRLTQHSLNIHKKVYTINPTLAIIGFGGSVPGYTQENGKKTYVWDGFPFESEEEMSEDAGGFLASSMDLKKDSQVVLLSHIGPFSASTTLVRQTNKANEDIYSGSTYLDALLNKYSDRIIANVHGHTHDSQGRNCLYKIPIINPGSLIDGNFCKINLHKDSASSRWVVRSSNFINLNSF